MAGRPLTRARQEAAARQAQGPRYGATVGDALRGMDRLLGPAQPQDPAAQAVNEATAELAKSVKHKAHLATLAETERWADERLNPPQGGDPVSTEALQLAVSATKDVAETYRQEADRARAQAQDVAGQVSAARQEGQQQASSIATVYIQAMERSNNTAVAAVQASSAAAVAATQAAADAQVASAKEQAAFFRGLAEAFMGVSAQQRAQVVQPAPAPGTQLGELLTLMQGLRQLGAFGHDPMQVAQANAQTALVTSHISNQERMSAAGANLLNSIPETVAQIVDKLKPGTRLLPSSDPGGSVNGIGNAPPPQPAE